MLQLELPHVNVLSKFDLLRQEELGMPFCAAAIMFARCARVRPKCVCKCKLDGCVSLTASDKLIKSTDFVCMQFLAWTFTLK